MERRVNKYAVRLNFTMKNLEGATKKSIYKLHEITIDPDRPAFPGFESVRRRNGMQEDC
jgi:hypothetical protein